MSTVAAATSQAARSTTEVTYRPWYSFLALLSLDIGALTTSFGLAILVWSELRGEFLPMFYVSQWPVVVLFLLAYGAAHLYRVAGCSPVDELRRLVLTTTAVFSFIVLVTFLTKESAAYSRGILILACLLTIVLLPAIRLGSRSYLGRQEWFARPVAIFGAGRTGTLLLDTLREVPELALRPVVAFDDDSTKHGVAFGVPVIGGLEAAPSYCRLTGIDYAIIAMPGQSRQALLSVIRRTASHFSEILLVPDLFGVSSVWVEARDLGGTLGLEIRDNLMRLQARITKRLLELGLIIVFLPITLPLCLIVALIIKATSEGPVLYAQSRVGKDGILIRVWKFRTMVKNAEEALRAHLDCNRDLWSEWQLNQKLKRDPRVTPVGRLLRRTSLDELPQLWNVVRGDMSLVGPRPIVASEAEKFGDTLDLYTRVLPGITGPWQASGRNRLRYDERVRLNEYYVRNWSVWLDLYILFKTVRVVLSLDDAY